MTKFTYTTGDDGEQSDYFPSIEAALKNFHDSFGPDHTVDINTWSPTSAEHAASFIDADLVLEHIHVQDGFNDEGCPQDWADDTNSSPHRHVLTERLQAVVENWLVEFGLIPEFLTLDHSDVFVHRAGVWELQVKS